MRGNYQEEEPKMKFTPESSVNSRIYQTQRYTRQQADTQNSEVQETFSLLTDKDADNENL